MTTHTATGRALEVPDLVGDKAAQAIQRLREAGLMPITWSIGVDDVNEAGFVLGLDPPPGSPVRPKTHVTMSVATHPDFQGHVEDTLAAQPNEMVQPPLTWPLSGPTGFAPADPEPAEALTDASATAATPGAPSAPASPPLDAAYREIRQQDAAASSVGEPAPGMAADPYLLGVSAPVPTPEEISADAEWDRLRAAEAARHAAGAPPSGDLDVPPAPPGAAVDAVDDTVPHDSAEALEKQARREARRRSARRHRRLTAKQKALVAGVLAVTLLIVVAAMSGHKPVAHPPSTGRTAAHQGKRPTGPTSASAAVRDKRAKTAAVTARHKRTKTRTRRVITVRRTRTRVETVTVHSSAPATPQRANNTPVVPVSTGPSDTAAPSTGAGAPTATTPPAAPTSSHKPASTSSATGSRSSGTGGGSTLQSPGGATAPPQP